MHWCWKWSAGAQWQWRVICSKMGNDMVLKLYVFLFSSFSLFFWKFSIFQMGYKKQRVGVGTTEHNTDIQFVASILVNVVPCHFWILCNGEYMTIYYILQRLYILFAELSCYILSFQKLEIGWEFLVLNVGHEHWNKPWKLSSKWKCIECFQMWIYAE